ncbi:MAG: ABC transporter permease [Methanomicrobiales archaeon]|nr:ABC transporter permease [Methanomicrobiales archaeon]
MDIVLTLSFRSIRLHGLRSILATLGIIIGVVAIASMGMMGANLDQLVTSQLSSLGNVLVVRAYTGPATGFEGLGGGGGGGGASSTLTSANFQTIQRVAEKYGTVYFLYTTNDIITIKGDEGFATIYGMTPESISKIFTLRNGTFPRTTGSAVIGPSLADRWDLKVGDHIKIGSAESSQETIRVAGILEPRGLSVDLNSDNAIIAPDKWYTNFYGGEGQYNQVNVAVTDIKDIQAANDAINNSLNHRKNVVSIFDSSRLLSTITSAIGSITAFVMAIAAISLLVAAVAIFNVMMMSVTERTHEIGILRSIGTQRKEIRKMFLYESLILGVIGAFIGAALSLLIGYTVVLLLVGNTEFFFTLQSFLPIGEAILVGILVTVLSGAYPAWKASNLNPIEALRAE